MARPHGYDVDGYVHFIEKEIDSIECESTKRLKDKEMFEIEFDAIERINLNKIGNEIPFTNNVVNLERYMMMYWKPLLDSDCILLYLHLWEYCKDRDDGVDMIYPKIKDLIQRFSTTRPTLLAKLKKLEEYNFLVVIHRLNKRNGNKEDSPVIKLRRTIPMLTREQYYKLNPYLQKKHDEYMDKFANDMQMRMYNHDGENLKVDLIQTYGDKIITKKMREEIDRSLMDAEAEQYILEHLDSDLKDTLMTSKDISSMLIDGRFYSKPTAEMYFKDVMSIYNKDTYTVTFIAKDDSQKEFIYEVPINADLPKLSMSFESVYGAVSDFKCLTRKQYIVNVLKGK
jgi:hypothetical protein